MRGTSDRRLPYVSGVGWETASAPEYRWDGMRRGARPCAVFQYTVGGAGVLEQNGRQRRVEPGQCFLVDIPGRHVYYHPPGGPEWEFVFVVVAGDAARPIWQRVIERLGPVFRLDPACEALEIFKGLYARGARGQFLAPLENAEIAVRFLLALLAGGQDGSAGAGAMPGTALDRAVKWASANLRRGASVKGMARAAGLSRHHFSRLFQERTGQTPVACLNAMKIRRAAALLRENDDALERVARRAGFSSAAHMCRAFRKSTGHSPGEVRRDPHLVTRILTRPG